MDSKDRIKNNLEKYFSALVVEVQDESAEHAGHREAGKSTGTHFSVLVVSDAFQGQTRLERHRAIYEALEAEFKKDMHALRIRAHTPTEWKKIC